MNYCSMIAALGASILVAGCSAPSSGLESAVNDQFSALAMRAASPTSDAVTLSIGGRSKAAATTVYVANSGEGADFVTVYSANGKTVLRTISEDSTILGMTTDKSGHVFVSTYITGKGYSLEIFGQRGAQLLQTLTQKHAFVSPTLDSSGNLWTWCSAYELCEYAAGGKDVVQETIIQRIRLQKYHMTGNLAAGPSGNIAIIGGNQVWVYAPGKTQPYWKISTSAEQRVGAFDDAGNLYVSGGTRGPSSSVLIYSPKQTEPSEVLSDPNGSPVASLAFDAAQNLYVFTPSCEHGCEPTTVTVYQQGISVPIRTIQNGLRNLFGIGMAVNSSGGVYVVGDSDVSNPTASLVIYAPKKMKPHRTVSLGLFYSLISVGQ